MGIYNGEKKMTMSNESSRQTFMDNGVEEDRERDGPTSSSTTWRTCGSRWRTRGIVPNGEGEPMCLTPPSHADLNRHLCIMGIRQDSGCPLCQEEDDTTVHLIAQCSALMLLRKEILRDFTLPLDTLSDIHWHLLLRFAKASKRFYRP